MLTADCVPVLLADAEAGVVGAAHAGWRGTRDGIIGTTLDAMKQLGASPRRTVAVVGPAIGEASYEVGPDLVQAFVEIDPRHGGFFRPAAGDRSLFDLKGLVHRQLVEADVGSVDVLPHDTCADETLFFSNRRRTRRGEERFGLQLSLIGLAHSPT